MKTAGPERDREVAIARNDCCVNGVYVALCTPCIPTIPECDGGCTEPKPYSTDITAAMELWEEMFTPQFHNLCVWDIHVSGFCPSQSNPKHYFSANIKNKHDQFKYRTGNVRHATVNEAMADAISGAYLKWRKGQ